MAPIASSEPPAAADPVLDERRARFAGLRATLSIAHRSAAPEAFVLAEESVVSSGLTGLDLALGGGFPKGIVATLEGGAGSGASAIAMRLLAAATFRGLGALIELDHSEAAPASAGRLLPQSLAAAGVDLERLLVVPAADVTGVARAVDIVLRSAAFSVVVMPSVPLAATVWTRLASLAHRANAVLLTLGGEASHELRYFASLRVRLQPSCVHWAGGSGIFATLAGFESEAAVLKHKRAAPGRLATIACTTFETGGAPLMSVREQRLVPRHVASRPSQRVLAG